MVNRALNKDIPVNLLRLQASERNEDWPEKLFNKFKDSITQADIKFYPNLNNLYIRLKEHYNYTDIILGTGSDKCIEYFIQAHSKTHTKLVIFDPCFPMYFVYGEVYGYEVVKIKQENSLLPYDNFLSSIDKDTIAIITNPSSPMGQEVASDFISKVLEQNVPTLIDEAYIEFSDCKSADILLNKFSNLFICRTFSKALGSAGIRLGIITSSFNNINLLQQFRPMFEINGLTAKWADLILDNYNEVEQYIEKVKLTRSHIIQVCKNKNIPYINGNSNWIHIIHSNLPDNIVLKTNCKVPGSKEDWVRLQITTNKNDYKWL